MQTLPVFLDVKGKHCLLVGEGEVALRKRRLLDKAGASVFAVSDHFTEEHLDGAVLVVAASVDDVLNERVSRAAQLRNIPVNVVDRPALCTFIFPSIVERGPITVAISSGGAVPVLTRLLRARIETLLPASLGNFAQRVSAFRKQVSLRLPDMQQRLRFWDQLLQRELIGADGDMEALCGDTGLEQQLDNFVAGATGGFVSIVGAGPGDADLLTFKALRCLQGCDVGDLDSFMTIDIALARGLDYYTGAIFEVKAAEGTLQSSICGGGRYDDLTGIFGLKNMSGVGISFGADRIYDVLLETGKFPADLGGSTKLLFANFGEAEALHCLKLLRQVREAGIAAELYPDAVKMAKQFKYADDKGIPYVAIIGGNEIQTGIVTIKDMKTGEQKAVKQDELIDVIIGSEA